MQGLHEWGLKKGSESKERTCPICMDIGPFVALTMAFEPASYCDSGPLSHAFVPCGHMVPEKTVTYWANIPIPHGTKGEWDLHALSSTRLSMPNHCAFTGLQAECPFCATPLEGSTGFVRLIFQDWIS